jgi:hypothetical protein
MKMMTMLAFQLLILVMPNLAPAQTEPAPGQQTAPEQFVYKWTDDNGVVHMTDDPSKVPGKYRNKTLKQRAEPAGEEVQEQPQREAVGPAPESSVPSDQEFEQNLRKDEVQQRYLDWKDKLQRAEQRLQSLQQQRADLVGRWGSLAVAPLAVRDEVSQVDKSLQDTQAAIDEARHMLEVVLPDDARKAGVRLSN